eukprot:5349918-Amphidinium_carterae.1
MGEGVLMVFSFFWGVSGGPNVPSFLRVYCAVADRCVGSRVVDVICMEVKVRTPIASCAGTNQVFRLPTLTQVHQL